ncbi:HNH endonuclease [Clostridium thermosuccinogenes]|uniref:HNH endonuclease n=1 Tax=Clostridium thermosuccinogenes TaxID=84032 RepID=A0A2K2EZI3_9CLOT|nr:HNH endonuclease [Pseudoclostridium thermosuccinogenes]AUS95485.1 HNH endonuclease [Pseudoclostridium thermosuccinogenes]PNT91927.1 HNH endonuclease [Pseudoclostridium thermosuccinogenes]PNT94767.1 HNH endonuclease [Pseudoclostridium thermosuccinogenes]
MFYNTRLDISKEVWSQILTDREVTTESDLNILKIVYESKNHEIGASEIASKLNIPHHVVINLQISRFSKRVINKTGAQPPLRKDGKPRWWHVPFLGYEKGGKFPWIMRPELVNAFEEVFGQSDTESVYSGEIIIEDITSLPEGTVSQVFVNRYERNRKARNICIDYYGSKCAVCGFDFERTYGPIGKDKIHIHHLVPLSKVQKEYEVDPIQDLRPVCPNCHLIIHSKREPFTIEEVREMITMSNNG